MTRHRPARSIRLLFSLLVCCCCRVRARHHAPLSSDGPAAVAVEGTSTTRQRQRRQRQQQQHAHPHHQQAAVPRSTDTCFVASDLSARAATSRIRRSDGGRRRSSSSRSMVMSTTRSKRGISGKPRSKNGVGKKVRRILEPASREEVRRGACCWANLRENMFRFDPLTHVSCVMYRQLQK